MKFIFKALFIASILSIVGFYAYYLKTGKTPQLPSQQTNLPEFDFADLKDSTNKILDSISSKEEKKYMYKWRDDKNVMHYTSKKPETGVAFETIELSSDVNVMPAVTESSSETRTPEQTSPSDLAEIVNNPYAPGGVEQLLNQAKGIQEQVNQRFEHQ